MLVVVEADLVAEPGEFLLGDERLLLRLHPLKGLDHAAVPVHALPLPGRDALHHRGLDVPQVQAVLVFLVVRGVVLVALPREAGLRVAPVEDQRVPDVGHAALEMEALSCLLEFSSSDFALRFGVQDLAPARHQAAVLVLDQLLEGLQGTRPPSLGPAFAVLLCRLQRTWALRLFAEAVVREPVYVRHGDGAVAAEALEDRLEVDRRPVKKLAAQHLAAL
mmetsp:Transcript_31080/g.89114  ORF Transcript_31080/g.89114 Transcript_31080/m.89114 type:complete len:220 (-) Transcript_31080:572-1231(-)